MIMAFLAIAATSPTTQLELVSTFHTLCLRDGSPLEHIDAKAAAAGFRPVSALKARTENHETKAWVRAGIRLFVMSGQSDPRWIVSPSCGVSADVGRLRDERKLVREVSNAAQAVMASGGRGAKRSIFHLPRQDDKGMTEVIINGENPAHVRVTLLLQIPNATAKR